MSGSGQSEGPMDARFGEISLLFPGRHFRRDQRLAVEPSVQALAIHDVDLRFRHVQPTAVLGCVMKFDLIQDGDPVAYRQKTAVRGKCRF